MPLAVYRNSEIGQIGARITAKRKRGRGKKPEERPGTLLGVDGSGKIHVRFDDCGTDEEIDPADATLTVGTM